MTHTLDEVLNAASVIPVLVVDAVSDAPPLARALKAGGLRVVELTLRTPAALDAMKAMQDAEPDLIVGMGTVRTFDQVDACRNQGAAFLVSPGLTPMLESQMMASGLPCRPRPAV